MQILQGLAGTLIEPTVKRHSFLLLARRRNFYLVLMSVKQLLRSQPTLVLSLLNFLKSFGYQSFRYSNLILRSSKSMLSKVCTIAHWNSESRSLTNGVWRWFALAGLGDQLDLLFTWKPSMPIKEERKSELTLGCMYLQTNPNLIQKFISCVFQGHDKIRFCHVRERRHSDQTCHPGVRQRLRWWTKVNKGHTMLPSYVRMRSPNPWATRVHH